MRAGINSGRHALSKPLMTLAFHSSLVITYSTFFLLLSCGDTKISGDAATDALPDEPSSDTFEDDATEIECPPCDDGDDCTVDACDTMTGICVHSSVDQDADGHPASSLPDGTACGGDDCDDLDPLTYPGAPEICNDGVDQDCDGAVDTLTMVRDPLYIETPGGTNHEPPAIAWTGSEYGILVNVIGDPVSPVTHLIRIAEDGGSVISDSVISDPIDAAVYATFVWTGSEYGVASSAYTLSGDHIILFSRISGSGEHLAPATLIAEASGPGRRCDSPAIEWTGYGYGITWVDNRDGIGNEDPYGVLPNDIYFSSVDRLGTKTIDDIRVTDDYGWAHYPSIAWSGSLFWLAWADHRVPVSTYGSRPAEFFLTSIEEDGLIIGPETLLSDESDTNCGDGRHRTSLDWSDTGVFISWSNKLQHVSESLSLDTFSTGPDDLFRACIESSYALDVTGDSVVASFSVRDAIDASVFSLRLVSSQLEDLSAIDEQDFLATDSPEDPIPRSIGVIWSGAALGAVWRTFFDSIWYVGFTVFQLCE